MPRKKSKFVFQGNELAMEAVYTSEDLVETLLKSNQACPVKKNPQIHFGEILGKGVDGVVSEVKIQGYGKREFAVKVYKQPMEVYKLPVKQSFREIMKINKNIPESIFIHANPGKINRVLEKGDEICIPKVKECKTKQGASYQRFDGLGWTNIPPGSYLCDDVLYSEYYIGVLCGKLYRGVPLNARCEAKCINFMEIFGFTSCAEPCMMKNYLFMEKVDSTMRKYKHMSLPLADSLYLQLLLSLSILQETYQIVHGDLHADNIFLQRIEPDMEYNGVKLITADYFVYKMHDTTFYVKNYGVILKLGDYGRSVKYSSPVVGDKQVLEGGYKSFFKFPGIPNWFSPSYDVLFASLDMSNYSNLAEDVMNDIQSHYYKIFDKNYSRPYPSALSKFDSFLSPGMLLMKSDRFSKFRERPSGKMVLVGEMVCK